MNLNGPGTSLFQGNEFINFDVLGQGQEEEEDIEDQRRREIEVSVLVMLWR